MTATLIGNQYGTPETSNREPRIKATEQGTEITRFVKMKKRGRMN